MNINYYGLYYAVNKIEIKKKLWMINKKIMKMIILVWMMLLYQIMMLQ